MIEILRDIKAELDVSITQSLPSDDQIIMDHIKSASSKLDGIIKTLTREGMKQ